MSTSPIKEHLIALLSDYRDFNSSATEPQPIPTAVEFVKQVSKGYPAIYKAYTKFPHLDSTTEVHTDPSILESPAFSWTKADLLRLVQDRVEVAVTPSGRADDLHTIDGQDEPVFLAPATVELTLDELFGKLDGDEQPVYYLQSQNSNLTTYPALSPLLKHIPQNFPFAEPVLGEPEAINIWIGDAKSITSTHHDPYENLYLVLKGSKTFTLYPPVDMVVLPTKLVRTGKYEFDAETGKFDVKLDEVKSSEDHTVSGNGARIPWVSIDPLQPREQIAAQHSLYEHASPRTVTVREGQILYLPSGWYHHVQQECGTWDETGERAPCIAVNYWFDMEYEGETYVMRQLIGRLVKEMREDHGKDGS